MRAATLTKLIFESYFYRSAHMHYFLHDVSTCLMYRPSMRVHKTELRDTRPRRDWDVPNCLKSRRRPMTVLRARHLRPRLQPY